MARLGDPLVCWDAMGQGAVAQFIDVCAAAEEVTTAEDYRTWVRQCVRPLLPHGALVCGHGRVTPHGIAADYILTVDFPDGYLGSLYNHAGFIETPILRHWLQTHSPVVFDAAQPWSNLPAGWLERFNTYRLDNAAAHASYDFITGRGSYFSFHRLPAPGAQGLSNTLASLTPVLHSTLLRVIDQASADVPVMPDFTPREREIARLVAAGYGNKQIASQLVISENTVKHHLTRILGKAQLTRRAQLAGLMSETRRGNGMRTL